MTDSLDITFSPKAYAKMMLHILKHLSSDCHGVLVGYEDKANPDKITITDVYPLFHTNVSVPQLDLGFRMIEDNISKKENKEYIVGIYENMIINFDKDNAMNSTSSLFTCDAIQKTKNIEQPLLVEISHCLDKPTSDGKRVKNLIEYKLFRYNNGQMKEAGYIKENENQFSVVKKLVQNNLQAEIIDMDDHLFNPKLDIANSSIDKEIEKLV